MELSDIKFVQGNPGPKDTTLINNVCDNGHEYIINKEIILCVYGNIARKFISNIFSCKFLQRT